MATVLGYIPVPTYPAATGGGWETALVAVLSILLLTIAITVALVYFSRPKAKPAVKEHEAPFELPKAA